MHHQKTVILYHSHCPDGFGGAYAAWKKFGDEAEYIPVSYGKPMPEHLEGRSLFFVDFCYEKERMEEIRAAAKSVVVLDHHAGVRAVATSFDGVFDIDRSGATIAWTYFHPGTPVPRLLSYLEDGDLYRHALPETDDIFSYIIVQPYHFETWDAIVRELEDEATRSTLLAKAATYNEYFKLFAHLAVNAAKLVAFDGYECYFTTAHPSITMKSYVARELYLKQPPISLVVSAQPDGFGVSIRGNGSVDVSKIAAKYGGNGNTNTAGFFIPLGTPVPWKEIEPAREA